MYHSIVLTKWEVNDTSEVEDLIFIEGRRSGLLSGLFSLFRAAPTESLMVSRTRVSMKWAALAGQIEKAMPLERVTSVTHGHLRPVLAAVVLGLVLMPLCFVGIPAGILYVWLNKHVYLRIDGVDGTVFQIAFRSSTLNGRVIDENSARALAGLLERMVRERGGLRAT